MGRGRTKSKLTLGERRRKAGDLFAKGFSDDEVARELRVTRQTVNSYRRRYEEELHDEARKNPTLLREVLANTMRSLSELDRVRAEAWKHLKNRKTTEVLECQECGHLNEVAIAYEVSDQARTQYLNVLLKAQDQRAKLFGVIGVKADMLVAVAQVKVIQDKVIDFIQRELGPESRAKLEAFLVKEMPQLALETDPTDAFEVVDGEVIEDSLERV